MEKYFFIVRKHILFQWPGPLIVREYRSKYVRHRSQSAINIELRKIELKEHIC